MTAKAIRELGMLVVSRDMTIREIANKQVLVNKCTFQSYEIERH